MTTFGESVDVDMFMYALENDILPQTTAYPGPRSILCFDNAKVHSKPAIHNLCQEHGVIALFLPQYSYDMNIRRRWGHSHPEAVEHPLEYQLEISLRHCINPNMACNEFCNVGMEVTEWEKAWVNR